MPGVDFVDGMQMDGQKPDLGSVDTQRGPIDDVAGDNPGHYARPGQMRGDMPRVGDQMDCPASY